MIFFFFFFLTQGLHSQGVSILVSLPGATGEALSSKLWRSLSVRTQFPVEVAWRASADQAAGQDHPLLFISGGLSVGQVTRWQLASLERQRRTRGHRDSQSLSFIVNLGSGLDLDQLWDSKQMLGGGGCWELLQMLVHLFPEASAAKSSQLGQPR